MGKREAFSIFDIPAEALSGEARITLTGGKTAHFENHRGIVSYAPEELCVSAGRYMLRLRGEGIRIEAMTDIELVARGNFSSLEYLL